MKDISPPHPMFSGATTPEWRPPEAVARDRKELLREIEITMKHARIFITSREKMHPTGVELYDRLLTEIQSEIGEQP